MAQIPGSSKSNSKPELKNDGQDSIQAAEESKTKPHKQLADKIKAAIEKHTPFVDWLKTRRDMQLRKQMSDEIDKQLQDERLTRLHKNRSIMLVGTRESGKTTIMNHMRMLGGSDFSEEEKQQIIKDIRKNVLDAIVGIIEAMSALTPCLEVENLENLKRIDFLKKYTSKPNEDLPIAFYEHVEVLWRDKDVQTAFKRRNEYNLPDYAQYFLDRVNVIKQIDYVPTKEDILHCYAPTVGIYEAHFPEPTDSCMFYMFEDQRLFCNFTSWKLIKHFHEDEVHFIVFVVACDSYNKKLSEDPTHNQLRESLDLFKNVWNNGALQETPVLLLFNKQDKLSEKILEGKDKLEYYFPKFATYQVPENVYAREKGESSEVIRAKHFIRDEFRSISGNCVEHLHWCYPHFICSFDSEDVKDVCQNCCCMSKVMVCTCQMLRLFEVNPLPPLHKPCSSREVVFELK